MQSHTDSKVRRLAILALFAALSFGIYAAEVFIPNPIPIPGIKLGLSNIIVLVVLRRYGLKDASLVLIVRLILSCLLFGSLLSLLYSAVGGVICLLVETLINRILNGRAIFVTAAFGALFHNAGQLAVAIAVTRSTGVLLYAPYLAVAGIITGLITGLCTFFVLKKLPKLERTAG